MNSKMKMTLKTTLKTKTNPFTPNLPNQKYQRETTKPNIPNQTYQTKLTKPNLPNQPYQIYQTQPTKRNIPNRTKHTKSKQQSKNHQNQTHNSHIDESKPCQSIKTNKDLIKARQVKACPELGTAQPQLVFFLNNVDNGTAKNANFYSFSTFLGPKRLNGDEKWIYFAFHFSDDPK